AELFPYSHHIVVLTPVCRCCCRTGEKKLEYGGAKWHETCFVCTACKKPIGTGSFFKRDGSIVCEDCHTNKFAKICGKCSKPITALRAPGTFEAGAFSSRLLRLRRICQSSLAETATRKCSPKAVRRAAGKAISGSSGQKYVTYEDRAWHNDCFKCTKCKTTLVGKGFHTEGLRILCPKCA
ncbi:PREDICTED: four and a half LIM domains protein 2-like, partial [Priapulus caudatus]|uniref:Four and a half LIM domains protein 2-like n=1 Tax=Priapulus caudatus TaxID=37621 RepID=A0ABM1EYP7_PRICU